MQIQKNCVVTFHYTLREAGGAELESNHDSVPMAYLHGHGNILQALENALEGLSAGDNKQVSVPPQDAYGARKENAIQKVPVKHLVGKYKRLLPKMIVRVNTDKGVVNASVIKAGKFMVELDMNHPFAGLTLEFDLQVKSVREASAEEIAHGHAHGEGGHHH